MLEAHGREVDWVLTTDHLKRVSDLPISDWVWEVDAHPNLLVYDIAANFASAEDKAAEDDQSAQIAEPVESLDLLRQIRSSLEAGVKIRLF